MRNEECRVVEENAEAFSIEAEMKYKGSAVMALPLYFNGVAMCVFDP